MVGEQEDPEKEQLRLEHARTALAMLNSHVIENGPGPMTVELYQAMATEAIPADGEESAPNKTSARLFTGMTYIAWELLAMREAEVGKTPAETLEELGRIFHPHPPGE
jgi:hypothetical protein